MYEVEVMLGRVDETHIIRSIEYWDIERRRWPTREHRAVIVAEEITTRFFNVIALFNRAIPMIAIKLAKAVQGRRQDRVDLYHGARHLRGARRGGRGLGRSRLLGEALESRITADCESVRSATLNRWASASLLHALEDAANLDAITILDGGRAEREDLHGLPLVGEPEGCTTTPAGSTPRPTRGVPACGQRELASKPSQSL